LKRALYAGDDATDLDAFHVLGELELGVRVGVASPESPRGITDDADVVVHSPAEFLGVLRTL
jgi:trehalose-6-phosphatase